MEIKILGIDLARQVFQLHGADRRGHAVHRSKVPRSSLLEAVRTLQPWMIAMEACSTAHHWARRFQSLGIAVKPISPQYVSPFVKTNKNHRNNADAIVEAASRPAMWYVSIKTVERQDIQACPPHASGPAASPNRADQPDASTWGRDLRLNAEYQQYFHGVDPISPHCIAGRARCWWGGS